MSNPNRKFLEFNGKDIEFVFAEGKWWVAVKPLCDALNVNYNRQFQNLKEEPILSQLFAEQQITGADGKQYKMVCLPERYIYGWLFSIRSESEELLKYKGKCYDVLYDYFEGLLTRRQETLADRSAKQARKEQLEQELAEDERYQELQLLKSDLTKINNSLKIQDLELVKRQGDLFEE